MIEECAMHPRIDYVSPDEVDRAYAEQVAAEVGTPIVGVREESDRQEEPAAVAYGLDHLPPEDRAALVERLKTEDAALPTAIHSYALDDRDAEALRKRGVLVGKRLDARLFKRLCNLQRPFDEAV
jgi:hypothetical protein